MQPNDMASAARALQDDKHTDAIFARRVAYLPRWHNRPLAQIRAHMAHQNRQNVVFYMIRAYRRQQNENINTIRPFCACIGYLGYDRPPPPLPRQAATLSFLDFCKNFFSENFSLRIKSFSEKFFLIFLFLIFTSIHIPPICRYCPFICPTIAQIPLYVQLVVCSNFNRLQRKYERLRVFKKWRSYVPVWVENKKLETFSVFLWRLGIKVLTLHPETYK